MAKMCVVDFPDVNTDTILDKTGFDEMAEQGFRAIARAVTGNSRACITLPREAVDNIYK